MMGALSVKVFCRYRRDACLSRVLEMEMMLNSAEEAGGSGTKRAKTEPTDNLLDDDDHLFTDIF